MYRKLYFTNLANPKNPNLNLDSTDYGCETCLVAFRFFKKKKKKEKAQKKNNNYFSYWKCIASYVTSSDANYIYIL